MQENLLFHAMKWPIWHRPRSSWRLDLSQSLAGHGHRIGHGRCGDFRGDNDYLLINHDHDHNTLEFGVPEFRANPSFDTVVLESFPFGLRGWPTSHVGPRVRAWPRARTLMKMTCSSSFTWSTMHGGSVPQTVSVIRWFWMVKTCYIKPYSINNEINHLSTGAGFRNHPQC